MHITFVDEGRSGMRAALLLLILVLVGGNRPAIAEDWIALWLHEEAFFGLTEGGSVYRHDPTIGSTELAGSLGPGPWVSFGKHGEDLLALKPNGEVWSMDASSGATVLYRSLPSDREWCALQQHPDIYPSYAISCEGEIWSLWEPLQLLVDFGPCAAGRWICLATADDSFLATLESGDVYQGTSEWCDAGGSYGPGPWVGFARTTPPGGGSFLGLKRNGEIWVHSWTEPSLYLALPADRDWCGFLIGPAWDTELGYALACSGEIWSVAFPPELVGTFEIPIPVKSSTWGGIRAG
jgi:hypothetical protein